MRLAYGGHVHVVLQVSIFNTTAGCIMRTAMTSVTCIQAEPHAWHHCSQLTACIWDEKERSTWIHPTIKLPAWSLIWPHHGREPMMSSCSRFGTLRVWRTVANVSTWKCFGPMKALRGQRLIIGCQHWASLEPGRKLKWIPWVHFEEELWLSFSQDCNFFLQRSPTSTVLGDQCGSVRKLKRVWRQSGKLQMAASRHCLKDPNNR